MKNPKWMIWGYPHLWKPPIYRPCIGHLGFVGAANDRPLLQGCFGAADMADTADSSMIQGVFVFYGQIFVLVLHWRRRVIAGVAEVCSI